MEPYRERIEDFLRRWRSRYEGDRVFRVLVITVVIAALGVTSTSLQQEPTYEASAQVWVDAVSPANGKIQPIPLAPTLETLQAITQTMVHAIESRPVAQETIQRLGLQMGPAELLDNLIVEQVENTSFILLSYEAANPKRAQQIANTVGEVSSELISGRSVGDSKYTATVYEEASVPVSRVSPHPLRNGLLTLVIGLVLWVGFLFIPRQRLATGYSDHSEAERVNEKKLLLALGRRGKLTAVEGALESELSVEEANRILEELAFAGQLEVKVEDGKLLYSFWGEDEA